MDTAAVNIEKPEEAQSTRIFFIKWMLWALIFFLIAALFGLMMRYFFVNEVPFFKFKNLLHAHSHLALLGWGYMLVTGFLVYIWVKNPLENKVFPRLLGWTIFAVAGMGISFPSQGYGLVSITFSTLHILVSYVFAFFFLKALRKHPPTAANRLVRFAVIWMLVSTIGLWAVGPIGQILGKLHPIYFMSIQWFLHFQFNGWFTYAVLGLTIYYLNTKVTPITMSRKQEIFLHLALLLTYAQSVTWSTPSSYLFYLNSAGVILQAGVFFSILFPVFRALHHWLKKEPHWTNHLIRLGLASLVVKVIIQLAVAIPAVAIISYTIRGFVIGFIHLIMLGFITLTSVGLLTKAGSNFSGNHSRIGWYMVLAGFLGSELLLFGQGTLLWLELGFLPHYYLLLVITSLPILLGLGVVVWDQYFHFLKILNQQFYPTKNNKSNSNNHLNFKPMKLTMLITLITGALVFSGCGGGESTESDKTETTAKKPEPDPRGVGEIKHVDLTDPLDEDMVKRGKAIADMKCTACHQLDDKRLVGPGFQGVTNRRRPEWIMNMITNVDVMLEEDPVARQLLEECLTRMPNQNISIGDSRDILEYLRKNDQERTGSKDEAANI